MTLHKYLKIEQRRVTWSCKSNVSSLNGCFISEIQSVANVDDKKINIVINILSQLGKIRH